jgi:hypothetical protein
MDLEPAGGEGGEAGTDLESDASPPGGPYALCGSPVSCEEPLEPVKSGDTCFCSGRCSVDERGEYGPSSCPAPPPGYAPPYCKGPAFASICDLPCATYGSGTECPTGLLCGVSYNGLRCNTTADALAAEAPPTDGAIAEYELYGACETFSDDRCPNPTGAGRRVLRAEECSCTRLCFTDTQCPAPPARYGPAICLDVGESSAGFCAIVCDPEDPICPDFMRCGRVTDRESTRSVSVCRGGIYRHGDGDDVIEPGEVYGSSADGCAQGLGTTTAGGGRCVDSRCERDEDCPAPPPGYPSPVCDGSTCWLSCETEGSAEECLEGLQCRDVGAAGAPEVTVLACQ